MSISPNDDVVSTDVGDDVQEGQLKQLPLAFVVMSRRRCKDYKRVFKAVISAMPQQPSKLQDIGSGSYPPDITVDGNTVQQVDNFTYLGNIQSSTGGSQVDIKRRKTLALPFLPVNEIPRKTISAYRGQKEQCQIMLCILNASVYSVYSLFLVVTI